jgi:hypothetical protein
MPLIPAKPSLLRRIAIGKAIGFLVGLAELLALPLFVAEPSWLMRWGILFWYVIVGALIGLFGVIDRQPMLGLRLAWWFRGPFLGAWMNFVLTLFAYDAFAEIMRYTFGAGGALSSPFWFVLEGAVVGLLIDYLATRHGGEGDAVAGR